MGSNNSRNNNDNIGLISQTLPLGDTLQHLGLSQAHIVSHPQHFFELLPLQKNTLTSKLLLLAIFPHFSDLNLDLDLTASKISLVPQIWARCPTRLPAPTPGPPQLLLHFIVCNCLLLICLLQSSVNPWRAGPISVLLIQDCLHRP